MVRGLLEARIKEIKEAKVELARISSDETQREIYEMREKTLKDKVSALNQAERKGERNKAIDIAKNLFSLGMDIETISKGTGLSIEEITLITRE